MKVHFLMDLNMEKGLGERIKMILLAISTSENIVRTKSMDTVNSLGNLEMCTKGITTKMKEMDMGKCILQTELFIRAIGREVFKQVDQS